MNRQTKVIRLDVTTSDGETVTVSVDETLWEELKKVSKLQPNKDDSA